MLAEKVMPSILKRKRRRKKENKNRGLFPNEMDTQGIPVSYLLPFHICSANAPLRTILEILTQGREARLSLLWSSKMFLQKPK